MRSPRLVAEALRQVPEPVGTALPPPRPADGNTLHAVVRDLGEPTRWQGTPPTFLRPHQVDPWRRVVAALHGWGAALLAEPVGSGKTWIALAVAAGCRGGCTVIGPASLAAQWRRAAADAGVSVRWHSLERLSRGGLPPAASLVIVDEAHRLRHRDTRRVATLAPWLLGRRVVLLTATPIVNRRRDLVALLGLVVADHALALDGIPSLAALVTRRLPPRSLRRLVIRSGSPASTSRLVVQRLRPRADERERVARITAVVDTLRLSDDPGLRLLLETVLLDAGASSDAAWLSCLRRYRALLLHCRDAGGASRCALRRLIGTALDQLVLWPMMGEVASDAAPPMTDLPLVAAALRMAPADRAWIGPLARLLADGRPTTCFCRHRATARVLVDTLGTGTAWVTGQAAGIGPHRMPRDDLLAAFGPRRQAWRLRLRTPAVLVTTEVLSEGIDLQGTSRVVHVDLPWHATRIEQRTGRVRRAGQLAADVVVVHRPLPRAIDRRLGMRRRIRAKGLVASRWLEALEGPLVTPMPRTAATLVASAASRGRLAAIAWVALESGDRAGCVAVGIGRDGSARLHHGESAGWPECVVAARADQLGRGGRLAAAAARHALGLVAAPASGRAALVARILGLARTRAASRDHAALARLDRLLAIAARPGPHGLDLVLERLRRADDAALLGCQIPDLPDRPPVLPRAVALLLFHREGTALA